MVAPTITFHFNKGRKGKGRGTAGTPTWTGVRVADELWINEPKPEKHVVIVGVELRKKMINIQNSMKL